MTTSHSTKYALVERERRFLVAELPDGEPWAVRQITDRYILGTRMRLRRSEGVVDGHDEVLYKLTQKVPVAGGPAGRQGLITNTYLSEQEYDVLSALPANTLRKTRFSFPPMGIDVFAGPLDGLLLAEVEFESEEEMSKFAPPDYCGAEVTDDIRFTGGNFVTLTEPAELSELLGSFDGNTTPRLVSREE